MEDEGILSRLQKMKIRPGTGKAMICTYRKIGTHKSLYVFWQKALFVVPFVVFRTLEGGHNSPPHVFFRHVKWNAAGSDKVRRQGVQPYPSGKICPNGIWDRSRILEMRRLQVDLIIFALEGGPWYGHIHTSFIGKMNHHSQNFPLYGEPKNLADPHLLSSLEGLKNLWLLYSENTWDGNMIIYISSFNYRTTTRRVSKTKDIKLLEENPRGGSSHVLL